MGAEKEELTRYPTTELRRTGYQIQGKVGMDIEDMEAAVAKWASTQPLIRKAYLFGSRVRGTHRSDSDLDVAVEIFSSPGDSDPLATWIRESRHLEASLAGIVPVIIDLEWYGGEADTPVIHKALER